MKNMTPIKPERITSAGNYRDKAKDGFPLDALEALIRDCDMQPSWRDRADISVAYYDGKQLTEQQAMQAKADGLEPRATNLVGRVINGVLGEEAKSRSDVRIESDVDEIADVVDVLNVSLKEAQRESYADMAVSTAYGSQVKAGLGWVEVSRNPDPLEYPYRVLHTHRNEMWYDWRAKDFLLRDARWQCRKQWHDLDELLAEMPEHKAILTQMANGWEGWAMGDWFDEYDQDLMGAMRREYDNYRQFSIRSTEWFDSARKRVKLYEVWYKVPANGVVIRMSPTRSVLYDESNPLHVMAVSRGLVKVEKVITKQVRTALFAGPYRLWDRATTKRNFPYVPFFAFRDDNDGAPYGLIEGMKSPQDEYNERRLRIQWLLKSRQVMVDNDALDLSKNNWADLANNVMRPDMLLVLNAARRNPNGVVVSNNIGLQKEQVDVMQDAKQLIQDVSGVYGTQLGNAPAGVTSGVAISGLVEQGIVAMGELNDNYRLSRRMVYENLMDLILEDHQDANLRMSIGEGATKRVVVLNTMDEQTGMPKNVVKDAQVRVGLSDVPASPAARMQQQQQLATAISALGNQPNAVAALVPPFLQLSTLDAETRRQAIEDFRKSTGQPPVGDRAAREAADQAATQAAQEKSTIEKEGAKALLDEQHAKVGKLITEAELNVAKAKQIQAQIEEGSSDPIESALQEAAEPQPQPQSASAA